MVFAWAFRPLEDVVSWFDAQLQGRDPDEVLQEHARYIRAARVDAALDALAGPYGCRRFVVRFAAKGRTVVFLDLETLALPFGGGPPPDDPSGERVANLEKALSRLHANMSLGPKWQRGAFAYLRDASGATELIPAFDDDADEARLERLPMPGPPGHPLEDTATDTLFALRARDMARVLAATRALPVDWETWEVDEDIGLTLHFADGSVRKHRCLVLATFEARWSRFTWRAKEPLGSENLFKTPAFPCTLDKAIELGLLSTALVGGDWMFMQPFDEQGGQLIVAVRR